MKTGFESFDGRCEEFDTLPLCRAPVATIKEI
jgi:hypothetical protein